ncbi:MAG: HEAT repeat domain-containing protein [Gemmatimonadales bacterium]|nr:HEAT repeat domain-containing protein [Gemmatimonadales bacterium]
MKRILGMIGLALGIAGGAGAMMKSGGSEGTGWQGPAERGPDSTQVAAFLDLLAAAEPGLCQDVADAFGNFWWSRRELGIGELSDRPTAGMARRDSLRRPVTDRNALALLGARLDASNSCVRRVAAKMLGHSWPASRAVVLAAAESRTARVKEAALLSLGMVEDSSTRDRIERNVGDADPAVAAMAAWALGEIEDARSLPALRPLLGAGHRKVRASAIWAVGQIEDQKATGWLLPLLSDQDPAIRLVVVEALGEIEDPKAASDLARILRDPDVDLRRAAAEALGGLDDLETAPPQLIAALGDTDLEVRRAVAEALASIGDPAALGALAQRIDDPDLETRRAVVQAIADLDHPDVSRHLLRALKDADAEIRQTAAEALGNKKGRDH